MKCFDVDIKWNVSYFSSYTRSAVFFFRVSFGDGGGGGGGGGEGGGCFCLFLFF